ncbi:MAG TPA: porin [Planctomycetaceae bacterium]|nr:porin [Planctomycetaceae bacterium]
MLQADGRFALDDADQQYVDSFGVRRLRAYLRGRIARRFEFYLNPDFAGGVLVLQDAYVDTVFAPAFRIRAGKSKTPFGMERLHAAPNILFMERAFPTSLVPNRDIGVQVLGDLAGGVASYMAGVSNGVPDGGSTDVDTNDGKDISGRLAVRPFSRRAGSALRGLGLAFSASAGAAGALPTFRTQTLLQPYFAYAAGAGPSVADGRRSRQSPQVWYFHKQFAGWGEYVRTKTPIRRAAVSRDIAHTAWQVAASWVWTGEPATETGGGVRPRADFDFGGGHWGALQVAARYHTLAVGADATALGLAAAGSSRKAEGWTAGLRWYLTGNLSYAVNYERTVFDGNANGVRKAENALAFRTQVSF